MNCMASFQTQFSDSPLLRPDKSSNIRTANYGKIPSWVSLKPNNSPQKIQEIHHGKLENVHLVTLSKQGKLNEAHRYLLEMDNCNVPVAPESYKHLLEAFTDKKSLELGKLIRERLGESPPVFLVNMLLKMYCVCGSLSDARELFDETNVRTLSMWVMIISAYADKGFLDVALEMYWNMQDSGFEENAAVCISLFKYCSDSTNLEVGKQMHSRVIKAGFTNNVAIDTALCGMYAKCRDLESAKLGFDRMHVRNAVTWTTMMVGCSKAGKNWDAARYFTKMVNEDVALDEFVFSAALKACAALDDCKIGNQIHCSIIKLGLEKEVSVGTPLVDYYVKSGDMKFACLAFDSIIEPNDVTLSALMCGYLQIGDFEKCLKIFRSSRSEGALLNEFMYTTIFQICTELTHLNLGAQVHGDAIKRGLVSHYFGESALITMYAKCGQLDYAYRAFESIENPDTVSWTAIIAGCAYHGKASEALRLFRKMQASGVRINAVTFIAVFTACSHGGLVHEARNYLDSMSSEHGVKPTIDHYNCMIDIYARAGLFKDALDLLNSMPVEPNPMSWKSLLGGCLIHKNYELGKIAAEKLLELDPNDTAAYILLFNLHASSQKWEEAANIRRLMSERDLKKEIGCSWINIKGKTHCFIVGDHHHPQTEEIYAKLRDLNFCDDSYTENTALMTGDEFGEENGVSSERREQCLVHSERLAIAFGLVSLSRGAPIIVYKNLRACKGCHEFGKHVSSVTGRTITVRDSNRFHHFRGGECSCGDYW